MTIPWSPKAVMGVFLAVLLLLSGGTTAAALTGHAILLNENQILYLFSTSAQVLAAIFGLTLTGFIFFRNELSREEFEDETLIDAVESLKARYYVLLVFITALVGLTLIVANLAIAYEGDGAAFILTIILNVGQSAFITSLLAVAYFIFDVISPKRLARASQALKIKLDPISAGPAKGSLEEFLRNYNRIEELLQAASEASDERTVTASRRRISLTRLAEILLRNERIDQELFVGLRNLITLRNSIIHGADPIISQEAVVTSAKMLRRLGVALNDSHGEEN